MLSWYMAQKGSAVHMNDVYKRPNVPTCALPMYMNNDDRNTYVHAFHPEGASFALDLFQTERMWGRESQSSETVFGVEAEWAADVNPQTDEEQAFCSVADKKKGWMQHHVGMYIWKYIVKKPDEASNNILYTLMHV